MRHFLEPVTCRRGTRPIQRLIAATLAIVALAVCPARAAPPVAAWAAPPSQIYGDLFVAVQSAQIYPDQKTFVDAVPNTDPATIMQRYAQQKSAPGFSLLAFVNRNFTLSDPPAVAPPAGLPLREHIEWLWPTLTRTSVGAPAYGSLIAVPRPYVVSGGRFGEGYYWDEYFTMLGLQRSGHEDLVDGMLDNFAYLIDTIGHVPNGNRTYYTSRSQPPFFAYMVNLAAKTEGDTIYRKYLPALRKEYAYWMHGEDDTRPGEASEHVVVMPNGAVLNRYWDAIAAPRDESYIEDVQTARQASDRPAQDVWRDLRAAAESGWDFSSRWFGDNRTLATIRTTAIVPVDLNSVMFTLEQTIAKGCQVTRDFACVSEFAARARKRSAAINRYLWNRHGYYGDYDWRLGKPRDNLTAAALFPLFTGVAWSNRARLTASHVKQKLVRPGGLASTTFETSEQWDASNGWAPMQWVAVVGLQRYGENRLSTEIGKRFLANVQRVHAAQGKLVEKYAVNRESGGGGGGGEYPLQDGFGWSNGVALELLERYGQ